jgi:hypothetical protein
MAGTSQAATRLIAYGAGRQFARWQRLFRSGALVPQQDLQALHSGRLAAAQEARDVGQGCATAARAQHRSQRAKLRYEVMCAHRQTLSTRAVRA